MPSKVNELKVIRETVEQYLTDGVVISDIVYRPFNMSVFGREGFSLVLYQSPNKMMGINFGTDTPGDKDIKDGVNRIIDRFKSNHSSY